MKLIAFVFMASAILVAIPLTSVSNDTHKPGYRILRKWQSNPRDGMPIVKRYDIALDWRPDEAEYTEFIRRFIREQKPEPYGTLMLYFCYGLDEYIPDVGNRSIAEKNYKHLLGSYAWNRALARKQGGGTLRIMNDKHGNKLPKPKNVPFDHMSQ